MVGGGGDTIRLKASRGAQGALLQILQNKMLNKIKQIAKTTHVNNTKKVALKKCKIILQTGFALASGTPEELVVGVSSAFWVMKLHFEQV